MTDFDKTDPAGTDTFVVSDDMLRANWAAIEERLSAEHYFPDNPFTSNRSGKHKFGIGLTADRDAAITAPAAGMVWLNTSIGGSGTWQIHNGTSWLNAGAGDADTVDAAHALHLQSMGGPNSIQILYESATQVRVKRGLSGFMRVAFYNAATGFHFVREPSPQGDIVVDLASATDREDALEAASTWYYLYLCWNGTNVRGKISSTPPSTSGDFAYFGYHPTNTPSTADVWRCIGAVFNNSTSDIQPFYVNPDGWWLFRTTPTASPFTQSLGDPSALTSYTSLAFTNGFPQTARVGRFHVFQKADSNAQLLHIAHEAVTGTIAATRGMVELESGAGGGAGRDTGANAMFDLPIDTSPTLKYGVEGPYTDFTTLRFRVVGWCDDFGLRV